MNWSKETDQQFSMGFKNIDTIFIDKMMELLQAEYSGNPYVTLLLSAKQRAEDHKISNAQTQTEINVTVEIETKQHWQRVSSLCQKQRELQHQQYEQQF